MLDEDESSKKSTYRKFVIDGMGKIENPFEKSNSQIIAGTQEYIDEIKTMIGQRSHTEIPSLKELTKNISCDEIYAAITKLYKRDPRHLPSNLARYSLERKLAIYLLRTRTDMTLLEIGGIFNISYSAVTQIVKKVNEELKNDQHLQQDLRKIDEEIES
jgi:chromosomal replication initiation ATPase DnaA